MDIFDEIVRVLSQGAKTVTVESDPEIDAAYRHVIAIIRRILSNVEEQSAGEAHELSVVIAQDPITWEDPIIETTLRSLSRNHVRQIHNATRILASRLPGETKIPSGDDESVEDEGQVEAGAE